MKNKTRRILIIALAVLFALGGTVLCLQLISWQTGRSSYDRATQLAFSGEKAPSSQPVTPSPTPTPTAPTEPEPSAPPIPEETPSPVESVHEPYFDTLSEIDLDALRQVNAQVLGWISIPDTKISYPLVQGEDNDYYLNHTWDWAKSSLGAIFLDRRSSGDLTDFHSVIYGHRMKNGSMFADLRHYSSEDYLSEHPSVYISDSSGLYRYDIFAVYEADVTGHTYTFSFDSDAAKQEYIDESLEQSLFDTGEELTAQDRIITLSTCTGTGYSTRWVVQAVLRNFIPA